MEKNKITAEENEKVVVRGEQPIIIDYINQYIENDMEKAFLSISGYPGAGKSFLVKEVYKETRKRHSSHFIAYVDVSDCADEINVYHRIAVARKEFLGISGSREQKEYLKQFLMLYEWIYGATRKGTVEKIDTDKVESIIETAFNTLYDGLDQSGLNETKSDSVLRLVFDSIHLITLTLPYVSFIKNTVDVVVQSREKQFAAKLLKDALDALREKNSREKLLRSLLLKSMGIDTKRKGSQISKAIIILDNFQLEHNNDLGRDQSWLYRRESLMQSVNAFWIIVSRNSTHDLFAPVIPLGRIFNEIRLDGFRKEQAQTYLLDSCPIPRGENAPNDEQYQKVIERMLDICKTGETYLPYILSIIAKHYNDMVRDPLYSNIKPEDFARFTGDFSTDDIFDYYFYKDMSDLMINAFQILSCKAVWDDFWIDLVRERFDNHLLKARNLLEHSAPIEKPVKEDESIFKLHEAVKDGLYRSRQNYIKKDVLKYFYDVFCKTYSRKMTAEQKHIWYDEKMLLDITELAYAYLDETTIRIDSLNDEFSIIYNDNMGRGYVSEHFIRYYAVYLDRLKDESEIPFPNHVHFEIEKVSEYKTQIEYMISKWKGHGESFATINNYLINCFKYADLYTNCDHPDIALEYEKLYLFFCDEILKKLEFHKAQDENIWNCKYWRIKALNNIAYDYSQEHSYTEAFTYGKAGLETLISFGEELLSRMIENNKLEPDVAGIGKMLLDPDYSGEFYITTGIDINNVLFEQMIIFYSKIMNESFIKDKDGEILTKLMLENHQKLRGNFPWYMICACENIFESREEIWKYGARTYWMRKAIIEAAIRENIGSEKIEKLYVNMLTSYHNVCVYLYKAKHCERACAMEWEVIRQSRILLKNKPLSQQMKDRYESIKKRAMEVEESVNEISSIGDISLFLWKRENLNAIIDQSFFETNDTIIDQIQYLGDYYLHMEWYSVAKQQFETVMLKRSVCYGTNDRKTLDTMMRLYITAVAQEDLALISVIEDIIETQNNSIIGFSKSKGILEKENCLNELIKVAKANIHKDKRIKKMVKILDDSEKNRVI